MTATTRSRPSASAVGRLSRSCSGAWVGWSIFAIALLLTFNVFIDIGPILAGAGILGLAVSFGAQSLVKDVISGFFILFENQFAIGDVIEVAGKSGVVEKMTLRVVRLRDAEGVHARGAEQRDQGGQQQDPRLVPRGGGRRRRPTTRMSIARSRILRDEAAQFSTDKRGAPSSTAPSRCWASSPSATARWSLRTMLRTQPGSQWSVAREFRRRIKNRFDRESLEIPFPQRRVHVRVEGGPEPDPIAHAAAGAAGG